MQSGVSKLLTDLIPFKIRNVVILGPGKLRDKWFESSVGSRNELVSSTSKVDTELY